MSDFLQNQIPEQKTINVNETQDLGLWCEELNLKLEELLQIIREVGPSLHEVRLHLAKRSLNNWTASY